MTFGDSITEGVASTTGAFRGWPDRLAERLQAQDATKGWSIVNAGIGSNRLLNDTPSTNALSRFDRDVLSVPGVKAVIVLLGINDIQYSRRYPAEAVRAPEEIAAFRQLIDRAHAAGIRIYGATITPFEGSSDYTPDGRGRPGQSQRTALSVRAPSMAWRILTPRCAIRQTLDVCARNSRAPAISIPMIPAMRPWVTASAFRCLTNRHAHLYPSAKAHST